MKMNKMKSKNYINTSKFTLKQVVLPSSFLPAILSSNPKKNNLVKYLWRFTYRIYIVY